MYFEKSPFVSFVQRNEDAFLETVKLVAATTPAYWNQHDYRFMIGDYMAGVLASQFSKYPLDEGRLVYDPSEGYDMLFQYRSTYSNEVVEKRISLKSVQNEVLEREQFHLAGKHTKPKDIAVKNRHGKGTGELERNFDELFLLQRALVSKKRFTGLLYGISCASFDKIRDCRIIKNDQIVVRIPNVEWDYCSGVRKAPGFKTVAEESDNLFLQWRQGLFDRLIDVGRNSGLLCPDPGYDFSTRTALQEPAVASRAGL